MVAASLYLLLHKRPEVQAPTNDGLTETPLVHFDGQKQYDLYLECSTRSLGYLEEGRFVVLRQATVEEIQEAVKYDWYRTT